MVVNCPACRNAVRIKEEDVVIREEEKV